MSLDATDTDETHGDEAIVNARHGRGWSRLLIAGSLAAVAAAVAVFVALMALTSSDSEAVPGKDSVDAGFARDMAIHHQQAVELSFIVRDRTDGEDVRRLAYDVINTQANQRGMLLGWLEVWGLPKSSQEPPMTWMGHGSMYRAHDGSLMPGMATNAQMDQLRTTSGKRAEVLYLRLLTAHHTGGIEMSQDAADMAGTAEVRYLAESMVQSQQSEMKLMADMLAERGAKP
ncbi:DUF305 domain-containing protein [Streptomyces sp. NBC_01236]|uniref:DUF305 domain-containing protein n=1 Tax=Streptomyces sp. NBC_01236 TaxID=2903789 RepID=UPI003FA3CBFA